MKVGDQVSVIAETISGTIKEIDADEVLIEDEHGFERFYLQKELTVVPENLDYKISEHDLNKDIWNKPKEQAEERGTHQRSFEIDLHIEELLESHLHLTNHEILTKQMTACKAFVQGAVEKGTKRIVLIHGKGEGVLKSEIHLFLNKFRNFNRLGLEYCDASFAEYGFGGATEVIFQ